MDIDHINHKIKKYTYKLKNASSRNSTDLYHDRLQKYHSMKNSLMGGATNSLMEGSSVQSGGDLGQFQSFLNEQFRVASERLAQLGKADLGNSEEKIRELRDRLNEAGKSHDELKVGLIDSAEKYSELVKKIEYAKKATGELDLEGLDDRVNTLVGNVSSIGSTGNLVARLRIVKEMFDNAIATASINKPSTEFQNLTRELSKIAVNTEIENIINTLKPEKWSNNDTRIEEMNEIVNGYQNIFELFTEGKSLGYNEEFESFTIGYVAKEDLTRDIEPIIDHLEVMVKQLRQFHEALYENYVVYELVREGDNSSEVQINTNINKANLYILINKNDDADDGDDAEDGDAARQSQNQGKKKRLLNSEVNIQAN